MKPHLRAASPLCRRCDQLAAWQIIGSDGRQVDEARYCPDHAEEALQDFLLTIRWREDEEST